MFDEKGVGGDTGGAQQEEQIGGMQAEPGEIHAQHQQNAQQHDPGAQPVRGVELLMTDRHRDQIDHQHVGLEQGSACGEGASCVAEICE